MPKTITSKLPQYLWQHPAWPALTFDAAALMQDLCNARLEQGKLLGLLEAIGLELQRYPESVHLCSAKSVRLMLIR